MAAATSSLLTPKLKRRKVDDEENSRAMIQHHWPEGVIEEILARLPAKSVLRFKSVCKLWYSLIQSRYFTEFHRSHCLLRNDYRNRLFFSWLGQYSFYVFTMDSSSSSLSQFPTTPLFDVGVLLKALKALSRDEILLRFAEIKYPLTWDRVAHVFEPNIVVVGPLNNGICGVIAEAWVMTKSQKTYGYYNAAFCNPATGEYKLLSPPPIVRRGSDELYDKPYYGFGCIQKAGSNIVLDYKMIVITRRLNWCRAFVYSQRRGSWKPFSNSEIFTDFYVKDTPCITQDLDFLPQAFVNGYCHWMADHSVLRFDITNEVFDLIAGPPTGEYPKPTDAACCINRGVFAINDHLAAIVMIHDPPLVNTINYNIDVWMMKDYGIEKSWTKIHSSKFQFGGELKNFLGMLFSRDNHDRLERMFFQDKRGMVLSYDCSSCTLREQCTSNSSMCGWTTVEKDGYDGSWACWKTIGLSYVETLQPLALGDKDE